MYNVIMLYILFSMIFLLGGIVFLRKIGDVHLGELIAMIGLSMIWPVGIMLLFSAVIIEELKTVVILSYHNVYKKREAKRRRWDK